MQNATALSIDGKLEGEKGDLKQGERWEGAYRTYRDVVYPWRSNASGTRTVHLSKDGKLRWYFATNENKTYAISLRYSNDGDSDTIDVFLDSKPVGKCITHSYSGGWYRQGSGWDSFEDCQIGNASLPPGGHNLSLEVLNSDPYGVEVDYVKLEGVEQTPAKTAVGKKPGS